MARIQDDTDDSASIADTPHIPQRQSQRSSSPVRSEAHGPPPEPTSPTHSASTESTDSDQE